MRLAFYAFRQGWGVCMVCRHLVWITVGPEGDKVTGLQQSTQTHRKIAKMHRSISSFVVENWNNSVPWADFDRHLCTCPTDEFLSLGMEKGGSVSRGITLQVSPALTSGDGGRFWWLLPRGRRLLTPKLFFHNTGMQCKKYLLMFVTTRLLHSKNYTCEISCLDKF